MSVLFGNEIAILKYFEIYTSMAKKDGNKKTRGTTDIIVV